MNFRAATQKQDDEFEGPVAGPSADAQKYEMQVKEHNAEQICETKVHSGSLELQEWTRLTENQQR